LGKIDPFGLLARVDLAAYTDSGEECGIGTSGAY
jgi:hypothetical protein